MFHLKSARILALALAGGVTAIGAQTPAAPVSAKPGAGGAYHSAFDGYRPFREDPFASWHDVNREVGRLGGHTGHLRDRALPRASPSGNATAPAGSQSGAPAAVSPK